MGNCISRSSVTNAFLDTSTQAQNKPSRQTADQVARSIQQKQDPPRPSAPPARPRASPLTQAKLQQLANSAAASGSVHERVPPEMYLEIAGHLRASDRASLSQTSKGLRALLPEASTELREQKRLLRELFKPVSAGQVQSVSSAVAMIAGGMHPADRRRLLNATSRSLGDHVQLLGTSLQSPNEIRVTFESALQVLENTDSPEARLSTAHSLAERLSLTRSPDAADLSRKIGGRIRDIVTTATPEQYLLDDGHSMASTLCHLNRNGFHHLTDLEREEAFSIHLDAMRTLHDSGYQPPFALVNPFNSASSLVGTFEQIKSQEFGARLEELSSWRTL